MPKAKKVVEEVVVNVEELVEEKVSGGNTCKQCGKETIVFVVSNGNVFCSDDCMNEFNAK